MAFALEGAEPAASLAQLQERLAEARRIKLTGWSTFLQMGTQGWAPYPYDDSIEAWVGRPVRPDAAERDPSLCDFWRASPDGLLYTIRGYVEDGLENRPPGTCIDLTLPVWRIGEGLLSLHALQKPSMALTASQYTAASPDWKVENSSASMVAGKFGMAG
jgi:hypothetical protein